jgi:hypothetical protein
MNRNGHTRGLRLSSVSPNSLAELNPQAGNPLLLSLKYLNENIPSK